MKNFFTSLELIEKAKGKNVKRILLHDLLLINDQTKAVITMCLDPRYPMYVGPAYEYDPQDCSDISVDIFGLMTRLNSQELRGNEALRMINKFIRDQKDDLAIKWVPRLVKKDLLLGIGWNSLNKVAGTKKYAVVLAQDMKKVKNLNKKLFFPAYVQPKLDGYRCGAVKEKKDVVSLKSRNGKEYKNFPSIEEAILQWSAVKDKIKPVFDGEIMSKNFQSIQTVAFKDSTDECEDVVYYIFDVIPSKEWEAQKGKLTFKERYDILSSYDWSDSRLKLVPTYECNSMEEIYECHKRFLEEGYEGTIIRNNTPYEWKRTDNLLKLKDMKSMDCVITDMKEGLNKNKGKMGALVVCQENNVSCDVGSGFTDEQRVLFWKNKEQVIGKVIEVKYQELTEDKVMRFPVMMRFRPDKG